MQGRVKSESTFFFFCLQGIKLCSRKFVNLLVMMLMVIMMVMIIMMVMLWLRSRLWMLSKLTSHDAQLFSLCLCFDWSLKTALWTKVFTKIPMNAATIYYLKFRPWIFHILLETYMYFDQFWPTCAYVEIWLCSRDGRPAPRGGGGSPPRPAP